MNRRLAVKLLAATSVSDFAISAAASADDEIHELDCVALLARIRDGDLRAEQVCATFIRQHERQRSLNAVTWIDPPVALSRARDIDRSRDKGADLPALAGLPILVKDNIDTIGFPTSAGTASLKYYFPRGNAPVVERLLEHGAIVMGKANMHELARGVTSSNPTFGFVRNPYDPRLIPGGSSGGCAAAIAARIVPAALGSDTGGSARIPAAFCGTAGFRPSIYPRQLYSQQGVVPVALDLDTIGPMARSVADIALLHAIIVGQRIARARSLKTVRIGVPTLACWDELDPEVERVARAALARLDEEGAVLVDIDLREIKNTASQIFVALCSDVTDLENFLRTYVPSVSLRHLTEQIASRDVRFSIETSARASLAKTERVGSNQALLNARGADRDALRSAYRAAFLRHGIDAVVFPTEVLPPPPIRVGGDDPTDTIELNGQVVSMWAFVRNTLLAPVVGAPAVTLPAGLASNGLPVGLEFDGLPGDDNSLLALGMAAESVFGHVPAPSGVLRA